ncbi:MAG TPA: DUF3810 family protein [Vicinamibacterales bacterium]|nr:DUF3810 family protein [Vicinamibacterales bacterium]
MTGVKFSMRRVLPLTAIAAAMLVAVLPPGTFTVERYYARWLYPMLQSQMTALSNRVPFALFDAAVVAFLAIAIGIWIRAIRAARKKQVWRSLWRGVTATMTLLAVVYLWFLAAWGLNYARPPLESQIPFDASRVTPQAVRALAEHAIARANQTHQAGHAAGFPAIGDAPPRLMAALRDVEREFGRPRETVFATPKWSIFTPFYRASGVSGQLGPFFLETLVNPDLTGPEREATLAHEWAHLSGFAPESDASFIGVLAALRAGPSAEYSGWLELVSEAVNQLQPLTQRIVLQKLAEGPRKDQEAIRERLNKRVHTVQEAAWSSYDRLLKSQGVEEGVESYSRVIHLLIGSDVLKIPLAAPAP